MTLPLIFRQCPLRDALLLPQGVSAMRSCLPAVFLPLLICLTSIAPGDESNRLRLPALRNRKVFRPIIQKRQKGLRALFKSSVRATLTKHCLDCHGGKSTKGDFDLSAAKSPVGQWIRHRLGGGQSSDRLDYSCGRTAHAFLRLLNSRMRRSSRFANGSISAPYDTALVEKATGPGNSRNRRL